MKNTLLGHSFCYLRAEMLVDREEDHDVGGERNQL